VTISSVPVGQIARTVHIGRQPIHDLAGMIYGYELLFRDTGQARGADVDDGDQATTTTILAAFSDFAVHDLLGDLPGFVNLTRAFLVGQLPVPFETDQAVLEVLETVRLDEDVLDGVERLHQQGYRIALDDFVWTPGAERLVELASIVKIDVLVQAWEEVLETVEHCRRPGIRLLAEKVEDAEMLDRCRATGFTLFQGYHLGRPQTLTTGSLSPDHLIAMQLLVRLSRSDVSMGEIESIMRTDPGLVLRLLRLANSAANGLLRTVSSITDAVVLLGLKRLRAWMVLISMSDARGQGADTSVALTRARTCELLAPHVGAVDADTAFTLGLLDGIATTLAVTPHVLLDGLPPLAPRLEAAMNGQPGPLRSVLDAVLAYEREDFAALTAADIPVAEVATSYLAALAWTSQMIAPLGSA